MDLITNNVLLAVTVIAVVAGLWSLEWWLLKRHPEFGSEKKLPRQVAMLALTGVGVVVIILMLPVDSSTRNQLLGLLGLVSSAVIGLSSTTLVANAMASVMLRTTKSIRTGDFLRVGDHFGRVTERGLLHTEIQTENRNLTTLPNLYLITNPFTVVRSSGTLVSVKLSLGYDVAVEKVEGLLLDAATAVQLEDPFVRVMELGNFAITYQVSGFLSDIKSLLSAHSDLCKAVIGALHGAGVEIVSPSFMNQRPLAEGTRIISEPIIVPTDADSQKPPEEIMFDKADEAEETERKQPDASTEEGRSDTATTKTREKIKDDA